MKRKNKIFCKHCYSQAANWAESYQSPNYYFVIMECRKCGKLYTQKVNKYTWKRL